MMFPTIRCYREASVIPPHSFFILCKGCNAGKPGLLPWTNSFLVICSNEAFCKFYYWLIYGLHLSGKLKTRHRGSAVPFINLNDIRDLIREVAPVIHPDWSRYQDVISHLDKLSKLKTTFAAQIVAVGKLQQCLLQKYFLELK